MGITAHRFIVVPFGKDLFQGKGLLTRSIR
jgi:hypothetical protein